MKIKSILRKLSTLNFQLSTRKGFTQHHLYRSRKRDYLFNLYSFCKSSGAGFTLIELLIVIAILGVLAAGILVAIDPVDKINAAKDAQVQNDVSGAGRAFEAYATTHNGLYPSIGAATLADDFDDLVSSGELKKAPVAPAGYNPYKVVLDSCSLYPKQCTKDTEYSDRVIYGQLKSKKFTATPLWMYQTANGKSCASKDPPTENCR